MKILGVFCRLNGSGVVANRRSEKRTYFRGMFISMR